TSTAAGHALWLIDYLYRIDAERNCGGQQLRLCHIEARLGRADAVDLPGFGRHRYSYRMRVPGIYRYRNAARPCRQQRGRIGGDCGWRDTEALDPARRDRAHG